MSYYPAGNLSPTTSDWGLTPRDAGDVWAQEGVALGTRAEHAYDTDPNARMLVDALLDLAVGPQGLRPRSIVRIQDDGILSDDERQLRKEVSRILHRSERGTWLDAEHRLTRKGLTRASLQNAITWGDSWAVRLWRPERNIPFSTRVRLIHASRVCNPDWATDTEELFQGMELRDGQVVAIHVLKSRSLVRGGAYEWERIEAVDPEGYPAITHLQGLQLVDRLRCPSVLAAGLEQLRHVAQTVEAFVVSKRMLACHARIIEVDDPVRAAQADRNAAAIYRGKNGELISYSSKPRPGMTIYVKQGYKVTDFAYSMQGKDLSDFLDGVLGPVSSATVRLPWPWASRRLDKGNMASSRVALHQAYATATDVQEDLIELQERTWAEWILREALASGEIDVPEDLRDEVLSQLLWRRPPQPHPDENRAAQAAQTRRNLGQAPSSVHADLGLDFVEEIEQTAEDVAFARSRGVDLSVEAVAKRSETVSEAVTGEDSQQTGQDDQSAAVEQGAAA